MNKDNERYFPNHHLEKEIALAEYNFAVERLSSVDQAVTWTTNVLTVIATLLGFASFKISEVQNGFQQLELSIDALRSFFLFVILTFSLFAILHISNLLRSHVFSERKIIVLRRMLGVSYGQNSLVLPNWRIEGADNPFAIRLRPGLVSYRAFPVWFIIAAATVGSGPIDLADAA